MQDIKPPHQSKFPLTSQPKSFCLWCSFAASSGVNFPFAMLNFGFTPCSCEYGRSAAAQISYNRVCCSTTHSSSLHQSAVSTVKLYLDIAKRVKDQPTQSYRFDRNVELVPITHRPSHVYPSNRVGNGIQHSQPLPRSRVFDLGNMSQRHVGVSNP